jgi:hypothetical protein
MSVILPKKYRIIAENLGEGYAKLRDSLFQDGAGLPDSGLENILAISDEVASVDDSSYRGSDEPETGESDDPTSSDFSDWLSSGKVTAPHGSIARDLGSATFTLVNTTGSEANAKRVAAGYWGSYLRSLNSHILNRMHNDFSTINQYYATYAYIGDPDPDLNLFDTDEGTPGAQPAGYFSADFVELSSQIGVTIDEEFQ